MLRIPSAVLDFADSAPTAVDLSAPVEFPAVNGAPDLGFVLVPADSDERGLPGQIEVPIPSWEALPTFLRALTERLPKGVSEGVDFLKEHVEQLKKALETIRASDKQIIDEYLKYAKTIPEEKFQEWFQRSLSLRNQVLREFRAMKLASVRINVISKKTYDELTRAAALIESMPDGTAKEAKIREVARRLVFKASITIRKKLEVTKALYSMLNVAKWGFFAVGWIGPSLDMLKARTYGEFKAAVVNVAQKAGEFAGGLVGAFAAEYAAGAVAGVFTLTPAGWVVIGVAIVGGAVVGTVVGDHAKEAANDLLPELDPELTRD